jgi:hypothetical protein
VRNTLICHARTRGTRLIRQVLTLATALGLVWFDLSGRTHAAEVLETLDGQSLAVTVSEIDEQGIVRGEQVPERLNWTNLRRWRRSAVFAVEKPFQVQTKSGVYHCDKVVIEDDLVKATSGSLTIPFPLESVVCLRMTTEKNVPAIDVALSKPLADRDQLIVKTDEAPIILSGLLSKLSDTEGIFDVDGAARTIAREKIMAIVLAQSPTPSKATAKLLLADGSSLPGAPRSLKQNVLVWSVDQRREASIPLAQVAGIEFFSQRIVYLSDLSTIKAEESPLVTFPRPYRRDASANGTPLRLGNETFSKGLGAHAQSELTIDIPSGAETFFVAVGIDADAGLRGDCEVKIVVDSREALSQRIRASESPRMVKVDVQRARRLTLIVEAGEDLDLGDAVDWADARFLLKAGR